MFATVRESIDDLVVVLGWRNLVICLAVIAFVVYVLFVGVQDVSTTVAAIHWQKPLTQATVEDITSVGVLLVFLNWLLR